MVGCAVKLGDGPFEPLILLAIAGSVPKVSRDQDLVYDACLQYDVDETPGVEPFVLDSPCGVIFSDGSELSPFVYRERLSATGANGYERCVNQNTRLRRSLR